MNGIAVSIRNVSKSYMMYKSPAHKLKEILHPMKKRYGREFLALRNVSFEIKKGESLGIIGMNGSGKSTLLKILCGLIQPTEGDVKVNGRISALLELGAGFNREFTGRENVYLNGAIMGFTKEEMDERFENITEFAEIGQFINRPVKTYSSGMYARLAFACAVHVDPDILIVDETLAVGDFKFKQKCSEKINELRKKATVILVSHAMRDIMMLCSRVVVMDNGTAVFQGNVEEGVDFYLEMMDNKETETAQTKAAKAAVKAEEDKAAIREAQKAPDENSIKKINTAVHGELVHNKEKITDVEHRWVDESGKEVESWNHGHGMELEFSFKVLRPANNLIIGVPIWNSKGVFVTALNTDMKRIKINIQEDGTVKGKLKIENIVFNPDVYDSILTIVDAKEFLYRGYIGKFKVKEMPIYYGVVTPEFAWQFEGKEKEFEPAESAEAIRL